MGRKKVLGLIFAVIILLAVGGYVSYANFFSNGETDEEAPLQTARVRRGSLIISALGSGSIIADEALEIGFPSSGTVAEIYVEVGDKVEQGDELAVLGEIDQLESAVVSARISLLTAKQDLEDLYEEANDEYALAEAEYNLFVAQEAYDDLLENRKDMDYKRCDDEITAQYYADYLLAQEEYQKELEDFSENYAWKPEEDLNRAKALSDLASKEESFENAQANWIYCNETYTEKEVNEVEAEIKKAKAELNEADRIYEDLKDMQPDELEIEKAEEQISSAEIQLSIAEKNLANSVLKAPISGTVMAVNAIVGEEVGTETIFTIADLEPPTIEFYIDETDMGMVGMDYEIEIVFDALPDELFIGTVTHIDPELVEVGNVPYVRALATLNEDAYDKNQSLPVGMGGTVEVVGSRRENVLLVTVDALREIDDGEYIVFVVENDELRIRAVEVGIMDYSSAEILSGLNEGDVVSTGIVETE